jgi:hypothetical protein
MTQIHYYNFQIVHEASRTSLGAWFLRPQQIHNQREKEAYDS